MDLMIPLLSQSKIPMYEQIYRYIKNEIRSGHLNAMDKLPSTRTLAKNLSVSRSTTQLAYDQLQAEGYIEAVPHKGYYVTHIEELKTELDQSVVPVPTDRNEGKQTDYEIDFSPSGIDIKSFPFLTWKKITKDILVDGKQDLFLSGDPKGEVRLRETICKYLHSARGVNCQPDQIILGAGNEYLLMLLHLLLGDGAIYAMEELTYTKAYKVLSGQGAKVITVSMDQNGFDVENLNSSNATVAYVMPSHQYPTGIVMPIKRRQELLKWAERCENRYLIEDDYDSEFRYKGKPIPALQGMDQSDKVIYMGTFSRAIAPAIRVGYMVLPKSLLNHYQEQAGFYSSTVSRIDQNILAQFIIEGHYDRHLNRMRAVYRSKQEELLSCLKKLEPLFIIRGEDAGVHILLTHKGQEKEQWLVKQAKKAGIRVYALSQYQIAKKRNKEHSTIVLGYASLTKEEIIRGVELLYQAWCINHS